MKILIVEDIDMNRKLLRLTLRTASHTVEEAKDGVEALTLLKDTKVDLIITDILMPNMDGYRLCYEIRNQPQWGSIPVIFYSSTYTSPSDEKLAKELGGSAFLTKSASPELLFETIRRVSTERPPR